MLLRRELNTPMIRFCENLEHYEQVSCTDFLSSVIAEWLAFLHMKIKFCCFTRMRRGRYHQGRLEQTLTITAADM